MKTILSLLLGFVCTLTSLAQYNVSIVTITLNGSRNQQVLVDGRSYGVNNNSYDNDRVYQDQKKYNKNKGKKNRKDDNDRNDQYNKNDGNKIVISNLGIGQHTVQVISNYNQNSNNRTNNQPFVFTIRQGFDIDIKVDGNGKISMKESSNYQRTRNNRGNNGGYNNGGNSNGGYSNTYRTPMAETNFNVLLQDVRKKWLPGQKMTAINNAFNTPGYYFSTYQVRQLVQLVSAENNRLQLLKSSFRTVTDTGNFTQLYDLLSTQASRDELDIYIRQYR